MTRLSSLLILFCMVVATGCASMSEGRGLNLYSVEDDRQLGEATAAQIAASPQDYPILDRTKYQSAYAQLENIMNSILRSGALPNADKFEWKVNIIDQPVLNAFAVPGGHLYFYTGLMKYLDDESQLAGVMAHEIAHICMGHSTRQMTKQMGVSTAIALVTAYKNNVATQLGGAALNSIAAMAFSRSDEYQADEYAVRSLAGTKYDPRGVAGFFIKLEEEGKTGGRSLAFLSTHPSPVDRIERIYKTWEATGSKEGVNGGKFEADYKRFKTYLP